MGRRDLGFSYWLKDRFGSCCSRSVLCSQQRAVYILAIRAGRRSIIPPLKSQPTNETEKVTGQLRIQAIMLMSTIRQSSFIKWRINRCHESLVNFKWLPSERSQVTAVRHCVKKQGKERKNLTYVHCNKLSMLATFWPSPLNFRSERVHDLFKSC